MSDEAGQVSTYDVVDTKDGRGAERRRRWPEAVKQQIVAETLMPGASVSVVARRFDVNANQVFRWRRQYEAGPPTSEARLVPVACGVAACLLVAVGLTHTGAPRGGVSLAHVPAHVTDVEYQGTYVLLGLRLTAVQPEQSSVSVLLSEKAFVARTYAVGESVRLSWSEADARPLGPGATRPGRPRALGLARLSS